MSQQPPDPALRDRIALRHDGTFDAVEGVLHCAHNAGFFSNCTVALWNIAELHRVARRFPARIDFSRSFSAYRNLEQARDRSDLYPLFFAHDSAARLDAVTALPFVKHHGLYRFTDYRALEPIMATYFRPSASALAMEAALIDRYAIDLHRTIAVVYRGTDKGTELRLADPTSYLACAQALLAEHPDYRVLIQTDELRVRDLFVEALGERCFYFSEMPVSADGVVPHCLADDTLRMDRNRFGVMLVAVTHLLSKAAHVVNHTGNMALWICLFRGQARGVSQFDDAGGLVDLADPDFYRRRAMRFIGKASHRLGLSAG